MKYYFLFDQNTKIRSTKKYLIQTSIIYILYINNVAINNQSYKP